MSQSKPVLDPTTSKFKLDLSPSVNHQYLADHLKPALAYDGGDVKSWQKKLRKVFAQLTGFDSLPKPADRVPLKVRTLASWRNEYGTIEKLAFAAEPKSDILAFLCIPDSARAPYQTFICVQGHSSGMHHSIAVEREANDKPFKVEGDRDFGLLCMQRRIVALCIEQRSFGERREQTMTHTASHGCHDATMHALMLGRTLTAERVFDVDRGIDYLATRGDIDMKRIGIMGNSGGGTTSLNSAALLNRIAFAMPSCYFCTFRDSIMSIYHCMDNYIPGILKYAEMHDIMGLFAPKPVVIVAGEQDEIFPIGATRKAFKKLKAIYKSAGEPNNCKLVVGPAGHRFYADQAWPEMMKFIEASHT